MKHSFNKGTLEAGCDEAGRGCLAGPVFAAAVILPKKFRLPFLNDSKQITAAQRDTLRPMIEKQAIAWAVASVDIEEIDKLNILWAAVKAMHLAVKSLSTQPECLLIDGNRFKAYPEIPHHCIIGGDGLYATIAAASVLAKTHRDEHMLREHESYPHYAWNHNKGYGTKAHREAILEHGISPLHRRGFRMGLPVNGVLFDEA